ncbi:transglycosylase domain-containing protein [Candidatus Nomurabacteria bacterium]|nr:transglycosylase domain-containing protein [Candidatus Nomurabacteria bacterium]
MSNGNNGGKKRLPVGWTGDERPPVRTSDRGSASRPMRPQSKAPPEGRPKKFDRGPTERQRTPSRRGAVDQNQQRKPLSFWWTLMMITGEWLSMIASAAMVLMAVINPLSAYSALQWLLIVAAACIMIAVTLLDRFRWWIFLPRWAGRVAWLGLLVGMLNFQGVVELVGPKYVGEVPDYKQALTIVQKGTLEIFSSDEKLLWKRPTYYEEVTFDDLPRDLVNALMASEDSRFMPRMVDGVALEAHDGVDLKGVLRAVAYVVQHRKFGPGGSTITMQAIKNLVTKGKLRGVRRKVAEWLLAWKLERELTKQEIMALYWNWAYLGAGRQGPIMAARYYWGKELSELSLAQCALLAGLVQSPENYRPDKKPELARKRRHYVLGRMLDEGFITREQFEQADGEPIEVVTHEETRTGYNGWIADMVLPKLSKHLSERQLYEGGITVYVTIDSRTQEAAHKALNDSLREVDEGQGFTQPLTGVSLSGEIPKLGRRGVVARVSEITEDFLMFELGGGAVGRTRMGNLDRFMVVSSQDRKAYDKALKKWKRDHRKWERTKKAKRGKEPEEPKAPQPRLKWKVGDYLRVDVVDYASADKKHFWVAPERVQGAYVLIDPTTHDIRALVCGDNYRLSKYNHCLSRVQPGSTFKPWTYLTALHMGVLTPWGTADREAPTALMDERRTYEYVVPWADGKGRDVKQWSPNNYGSKFTDAPMTVRKGLAGSVNSIAAQVITHEDIGWEQVAVTIKQVGITAPQAQGPSIALGGSEISPLELATAYATIGSGGIKSSWRLIERVETPQGEAEAFNLPRNRDRVFPYAEVWLLRHLMRSVVIEGSGVRLKRLPIRVDGKTGTTNDSKAAWFVGLDPLFVHVAWVGFDDARPMKGRRKAETGSSAALPVVKGVIEYLLQEKGFFEDLPPLRDHQIYPDPPEGVVCLPINFDDGLLLKDPPPDAKQECYLKGTEPTAYHEEANFLDGLGGIEPDFEEGDPAVIDDPVVPLPANQPEQPGLDFDEDAPP